MVQRSAEMVGSGWWLVGVVAWLLLAGASLAGCHGPSATPPDAGSACGFTARFGLSAVATGAALFAVGGTQHQPLARVETLGPAGQWMPAVPLPAPITWGGAAAVPGGFVVAGGDGRGLQDGSTLTEHFDLASGTWSAMPALPKALWAHAVASGSDGTVYAVGGLVGTSDRPVSDLMQLSPGASAWKTDPPMPTGRAFLGAAVGRDGRLYAIGGCALGCSAVLAKAEVYDPASGVWSSIAPMPTARAHLAVTAGPDGRIYAVGGMDSVGNPLDVVEVYDPATGKWTNLAPLPTPRTDLAAAFGADGRLRVLGGENAAFAPVGEIDVLDSSAGKWSTRSCHTLDAGWPAPVTFADLKAKLFHGLNCTRSGCHQANAGPAVGGFDLVTDPYAALLGPDGGGSPAANSQGTVKGLLRVKPGDPAHSLLWIKLSMHAVDYGTYGQPMPYGMPDATPPELLGELAAWIKAGAPGP